MSDLASLLGIDLDDPEQRLAYDLAKADRDLLEQLVKLRKQARLTQPDVARILGVSQPSVAAFERVGNDPRLSTIRRYALAIGARVAHRVTDDRLERTSQRVAQEFWAVEDVEDDRQDDGASLVSALRER